MNNLNCRQSNLIINALAVNESNDITDAAQLIFIRITNNGLHIPEEVASSCSLDTTATGENLFLKVQQTLACLEFHRGKLKSVAPMVTAIRMALRPEE
jgi:hypothetical protein